MQQEYLQTFVFFLHIQTKDFGSIKNFFDLKIPTCRLPENHHHFVEYFSKGLEQKQNQNMYWRRHNLKKRLTFEQLSSENKNCQINNKVYKNNNVSLHHYSFAFLFLLLSVLECPIGIHFVYSIFCLIRWRRCSSRSSERKKPN